MKFFISIVTFFTFLNSWSAQDFSCFPKSSIRLPVAEKSLKQLGSAGVNEIDFHKVIDNFERVWIPIIKDRFNKSLIIKREWEHDKVNAHATRDDDNNPIIVMQGGLARHGEMTKDGLLLILCHELGHHFGGAPKSFRGRSNRRSWSSAEGQADYFATSKCMPKVLEKEIDISFETIVDKGFEDQVREICNTSRCQRISLAALSVGRVFASLKYDWQPPVPNKKSQRKVSNTFYKHPDPQCRFDTFLAGIHCENNDFLYFDNNDASIGACLRDRDPLGARPQCWFSHSQY